MNNVEVVKSVRISEDLQAAIQVLARDYKKGDAEQMAENLLQQVVKGRLKAKRESASKDAGEMWDRMARSLTPELLDMLPSRHEFVATEVSKLDDVIRYL